MARGLRSNWDFESDYFANCVDGPWPAPLEAAWSKGFRPGEPRRKPVSVVLRIGLSIVAEPEDPPHRDQCRDGKDAGQDELWPERQAQKG